MYVIVSYVIMQLQCTAEVLNNFFKFNELVFLLLHLHFFCLSVHFLLPLPYHIARTRHQNASRLFTSLIYC